MGLSPLTLLAGTEIEIPVEDVQGTTFWIAGQVNSVKTGSLIFKVQFQGCVSSRGDRGRTRSRANMEITWRLPNAWERQPSVDMILQTQGFTPWHHPSHGSHWLRLQQRGAWTYGEHECVNDEFGPPENVYGWRKAMPKMRVRDPIPRKQFFTMTSAIENYMSEEDLGTNASKRDWTDMRTLRNQLIWWEETICILGHPKKERDRWSQVPPLRHVWREPRSKGNPGHPTTPVKQARKKVSCFHASTRVRIFMEDRGILKYKRMDKIVKGDELWARRFLRNKSRAGQAHLSIVECVMTFACQLNGQQMVKVECNLLTPDHYVSRGEGPWAIAGEQTQLEIEPQTGSASIVYNITLQEGDNIELGNRIHAATWSLYRRSRVGRGTHVRGERCKISPRPS